MLKCKQAYLTLHVYDNYLIKSWSQLMKRNKISLSWILVLMKYNDKERMKNTERKIYSYPVLERHALSQVKSFRKTHLLTFPTSCFLLPASYLLSLSLLAVTINCLFEQTAFILFLFWLIQLIVYWVVTTAAHYLIL